MLTTIKENACYTVKIFKNKYKKIFKQEGTHPVHRFWIRLSLMKTQFQDELRGKKINKNIHQASWPILL